ncbi:MAG TPA: hypothetical protein EYG11_22625 [Candidatus Latescibacteria bacterium]|nr:hypothetical protein [Candidatus Handelsmanbacteria bacterium]HIL11495.1 hypothetical protein [Candidatus Latescibacterota bacterium]
MKRIFELMMLVALMMVAVGCGARNVTLHMPQNTSNMEKTGTLIIKLSASMDAVSVTVDGKLVVKERNTRRIKVDGLREGKTKVDVFGKDSDRRGDLEKTETVEIMPGEITDMLVQVPSYSIKRYARPVVVGIGLILGFLSMIPAGTT